MIHPDWSAPSHVHAVSTTRAGGVSTGPYAGLNLGERSGDVAEAVQCNRVELQQTLPAAPGWVRQVHGIRVVELPQGAGAEADAVWTAEPDVVCAILTADCLPVLFCDQTGQRVAAAHAGWRGLAAGVLEATVQAIAADGAGVHAWLGPAIGQAAFEVGEEVRAAFVDLDPLSAAAFLPGRAGHWHADLCALARRRLHLAGVRSIHGGDWCTWTDPQRFFSFRRDGATGRMASLIWFERPV